MKKDIMTAIAGICILGMIAVFGGYESDRIGALPMTLAEIALIIGGFASAFALAKGEEDETAY